MECKTLSFRTAQLSVATYATYRGCPPDKAELLSPGKVVFVWEGDNSEKANELSSQFLQGDAHTTEEAGGVDKLFVAYYKTRAKMFVALNTGRSQPFTNTEEANP